ncbi:hypothetical protein [Floridanema evergladense]|uniref:Capsid protein n=1 Tax=Floridaenema evergladense BLCC-F167 TaxID=3153639 RepID=A0ABV4WDY1_9CYAN
MDNKENIEWMRYKQDIERTFRKEKKQDKPKTARIGERNPSDGTYKTKKLNGRFERGIKTSNGGTNTDQIVRGIPGDNNIHRLDWRNTRSSVQSTTSKQRIVFVYIYSKIEKTKRNFYVAGSFEPIKIKELTCPADGWIASATISLLKGVYYINAKYIKVNTNPDSKLNYEENETYILQYRSDGRPLVKITSDKLIPMFFVGKSYWWCPPTMPVYDVVETGPNIKTAYKIANDFVEPFSGNVVFSDLGQGFISRVDTLYSGVWQGEIQGNKVNVSPLPAEVTLNRNAITSNQQNTDYVLDIEVSEANYSIFGREGKVYKRIHDSTPTDFNYKDIYLMTKPLQISDDGKSAIFAKIDYRKIQQGYNFSTTVNFTFTLFSNFEKGANISSGVNFDKANFDTAGFNKIFGDESSDPDFFYRDYNYWGTGFGRNMYDAGIVAFSNTGIPVNLVSWHKSTFYRIKSIGEIYSATAGIGKAELDYWEMVGEEGKLKFKKGLKTIKIKSYKIKPDNTITLHGVSFCP